MNHIKKLQAQVEALQAQVASLTEGVASLRTYLNSRKFDIDTTVQSSDVLRRLREVEHSSNYAYDHTFAKVAEAEAEELPGLDKLQQAGAGCPVPSPEKPRLHKGDELRVTKSWGSVAAGKTVVYIDPAGGSTGLLQVCLDSTEFRTAYYEGRVRELRFAGIPDTNVEPTGTNLL